MRRIHLACLAWATALGSACTGTIPGGDFARPSTDEDEDEDGTEDDGAPGGRGGSPAPPKGTPDDPVVIAKSGLRRLSRAEMDATFRDLLLDDTRPAASKLPEENVDVHFGFDVDYHANAGISITYLENLETLVTGAAERLIADPARRDKVVPCKPSGPGDAACLKSFIKAFGARALRHPLEDDEVKLYEDAFLPIATESGDFYRGVAGVIRGMLTSPEFVYRVEVGDPVAGMPGVVKLRGHEVATRLSYLLLGTTPDSWLLDEAAAGKLGTSAGIARAAERLVADPRAKERLHHFTAYWLGFQSGLPPGIGASLLAETHALVDDVVFERRADFRELFTSKKTYLDDTLRKLYTDVGATAGSAGWVDYGASERKGILSHGAVLSGWKTGDDTSITKRGHFVRLRLLCDDIPLPSDEVNIDVAPTTECKTGPQGFYAVAHQEPSCASCHDQMDPIGFGLERYDIRGVVRTHDNGKPNCPIDGRGKVLTAIAGEDKELPFSGPGQLADALLETGKLEACFVRHVWRFAVGRPEDGDEEPAIEALARKFNEAGRDTLGVLLTLVQSPGFAYGRAE